jgi:hypothetical protein
MQENIAKPQYLRPSSAIYASRCPPVNEFEFCFASCKQPAVNASLLEKNLPDMYSPHDRKVGFLKGPKIYSILLFLVLWSKL